MNAPLPRSATASASASPAAVDLTRIFDPEIQLAQWQRPVDPCIAGWLDAHVDELGSGFRQALAPGQRPDLSRMPSGPGREALADDLTLLAEMLGELLDAGTIGIRLEVIRQAMCPRLHVDRVGIRMLCTYRGPGTEWVDDAYVDRRFLGAAAGGQPDISSGLLLPGHHIESIPPLQRSAAQGQLVAGQCRSRHRPSFARRAAAAAGAGGDRCGLVSRVRIRPFSPIFRVHRSASRASP